MTFFKNQDWVWGLGLIISGSFFAFAAIKTGVNQFRETYLNRPENNVKVGRWFNIVLGIMIPIEAAVLMIGWFYREWDMVAWWDPTRPFSLATCVAQWGMENVLKLARKLTTRKLITVFGCGGDRDPIKRPQMGRAAEHYSDIVIATADNPRFEALDRIMGHIRQGLLGTTPYEEIADREEAIAAAISKAEKGDLVLLLGKGHETTQTIGDESIPFNDEESARKALKALVIGDR